MFEIVGRLLGNASMCIVSAVAVHKGDRVPTSKLHEFVEKGNGNCCGRAVYRFRINDSERGKEPSILRRLLRRGFRMLVARAASLQSGHTC